MITRVKLGKTQDYLGKIKKYVTFRTFTSVPQAFTKTKFVIGYPIPTGECSQKNYEAQLNKPLFSGEKTFWETQNNIVVGNSWEIWGKL